jgi:hypothetical protein
MFEDQRPVNNSFFDAVFMDIYEWEKEHGKQSVDSETPEAESGQNARKPSRSDCNG